MLVAIWMGEPTSRLMVVAICSPRCFNASASLRSHSERSSTVVWLQPWSKADRAARPARSTSASVPSGTEPITSSVEAESTSMTPFPDCGSHLPPMYRSRECMDFGCAPVMMCSWSILAALLSRIQVRDQVGHLGLGKLRPRDVPFLHFLQHAGAVFPQQGYHGDDRIWLRGLPQ